jgi:nucleotide-binding universal stress UspA family protein
MQVPTHILVPTDGSELSRVTAERAIALAAALNASITFFHAKPERRQSFFGGEGGGYVDQISPEHFDSVSEKLAQDYLGVLEAMAKTAGLRFDVVTSSALEPYEGIIDVATARQCDLIVMASHGRRGIKGLILGSQTQKVLAHSSIPVLVYR